MGQGATIFTGERDNASFAPNDCGILKKGRPKKAHKNGN
jgi:hypothetical protein